MGDDSGNTARWLTVGLRPIVIIVGGVVATWVLLVLGVSSPFGDDGLVSVGDVLTDRLPITLEIAALGLVVGGIAGMALGLAARASAPMDRLVGLLAIPASILAAPVVVLTLSYWLAIRWDLLPAFGWTELGDDVGDHLRGLVIPSITIASVVTVPIASSIRDTMAPWRPRPFGHDAVAATVANRSGPLVTRLIGAPLGALLLALLSVELLLGIPGMMNLLVTAVFRFDTDLLLPLIAIVIVVGAVIGLLVDVITSLIGEVPDEAPMAEPPTGSALGLAAMALGGGLLAVLALMAVIGRVAGLPGFEPSGGGGLFSDGHILGTDRLGRDSLHAAAYSLWGSMLTALVPGVVASAVGLGLAALGRAGGAVIRNLVGLAVDVLWWPGALLLILLPLAVDSFSLTSPAYIIMLAITLIPVATRLATREVVDGSSLPLAAGGVVALVAAVAVSTMLVVGLIAGGPLSTLGNMLNDGRSDLPVSPRLSIIPGVTVALLLLALNLLGSGLLHQARGGRRSSPTAPEPQLATAAPGVPAPPAGMAPPVGAAPTVGAAPGVEVGAFPPPAATPPPAGVPVAPTPGPGPMPAPAPADPAPASEPGPPGGGAPAPPQRPS